MRLTRSVNASKIGPPMLRPVLLLSLLSVLPACALSTARSNVVVVTDNKAVVEGCANLGAVDGRSAVSGVLLRDPARDSALTRLKIATADLGGTHVQSSVADIKWKGPDTSGTAFKCTR